MPRIAKLLHDEIDAMEAAEHTICEAIDNVIENIIIPRNDIDAAMAALVEVGDAVFDMIRIDPTYYDSGFNAAAAREAAIYNDNN